MLFDATPELAGLFRATPHSGYLTLREKSTLKEVGSQMCRRPFGLDFLYDKNCAKKIQNKSQVLENKKDRIYYLLRFSETQNSILLLSISRV